MSYTNVAGAILQNLRDLVVAEFAGKVAVYWAEAPDMARAAEWIEIRLQRSENADVVTAYAETRRYTFEALYLRKQKPGEDDLRSQVQRLEVAQRLQRLLVDNSHYAENSVNIWYNGTVAEVEYAAAVERQEDKLMAVRMVWTCDASEIIS